MALAMDMIRKFLRRVLGLPISPNPSQVLLSVPVAPEWTPENAARLKSFLLSPTGQSFLLKARALQAAMCVKACDGQHDPKWASGIGWTLNWMEQLTLISSAPDAKGANSEDSLRDTADTLAPELSYV